MAMNRRAVLKSLVLLSGSSLLSKPLMAELTAAAGATSYTYLVLHGMFFMEFYDGLLYICTPKHSCHKFFKNIHKPNPTGLQPLEPDIDWSENNTVKQGKTNSFPTEILQFSAKLLNPKGLPVLPAATSYACKMVLPAPKHIFGYRTDIKNNFTPVSGKIADDIQDSTGPRIATITCLQYEPGPSGPFIESFYASHDHPPNGTEIDEALIAAKDICGQNFDLQFDPNGKPVTPATKDDQGSLPSAVDPEDENDIDELQPQGSPCHPPKPGTVVGQNVDVASCPQLGINH
jgi:hypothetical protein